VLGYVMRHRKETPSPNAFAMPDDLRRRLEPWIDVRDVGADGFWMWLGTVLPLLPTPSEGSPPPESAAAVPAQRIRQLARDLVDCARERARLTVMADRYYTDNVQLTRRLKALEAALRTFEAAGQPIPVPPDPEVREVTERYLPRRGR
jgi:hypothetical protein